jgi:hypothetical protein
VFAMSYCVNCGVELETSEKACPLCGVEVQNPRQPCDDQAARPYPRQLDPINKRINRHFVAAILSICVAFPAVICVVINLILTGETTWSLVVAGAMALIWLSFVPYFLYRQPSFTRVFLPIAAGLVWYLLLIAIIAQTGNWYFSLALPLILLVCGLVFVNGFLIERKALRGFYIATSILSTIGLLVVGVEIIVSIAVLQQVQVSWSLLALFPCLAVALAFLSIARRQSIREEIKRRLHL